MMKKLFCTILSGLFVAGVMAVETPSVVWWSVPVEKGELVQVHGGAWGTNPVVEISGERIQPIKVTETGLCFENPKAGLVSCRIVSEAGQASEPFVLNEPAVWWLHGDRGAEASPGGWLRVFGNCLSRDGKARVTLTNGGQQVELKLTKQDVWSLNATVPDDLAAGAYAVRVDDRATGSITIRPHQEVWKTNRFDVTKFGAIPNDGLDDTFALQAALAAAATNGGGVVYLPRGRFQCNGTLQIPEHTLLRGESRETTELYWPDCEEPPDALIVGTSTFGIEDLFIHSGKYRNGIVCTNQTASAHALGGGAPLTEQSAHDVTIRRVRLKLLIDQYLLRNTAEYEKRSYLKGNGLVVRDARFVRVEDCDIYAAKEGSSALYFILSAEYLRIANCRINGSGWAVVGGDKVIFENNDAWNCTYSIAPVCRNLFWSDNRQHDLFTNNRESITHDGARTAFRGLFPAHCDGTRLEFDFGAEKISYKNGPDYWLGKNVQLVEGRGAGQTRTIIAITNNTVTVDRPWSIAPDASSRFVVAAERQHLIYVDNYTEDSSIAIQLYGGLTEGVLARNRCARAGGFRGFGMDYHGIIPLWFVQYLDNQILEGNSYRGPSNEVPPRDSAMEILNHGGTNTLTRSCVIRRGVLHSNACINMDCANGIIENCVVKNSDTGIVVTGKYADSVVLRGNRFENVIEPLDAATAVMSPGEREKAMIAGAETVLGQRLPDTIREAVRALNGTTCDARVARSLLGATVRVPTWDGNLTRLIYSTNAAEATVALTVSLSAAAPETTCRLNFDAMPGWSFRSDPAQLVPGTNTTINTTITAPAGAKGFFRLPVTIEFTGNGWALKCRDNLQTLTENRITQWIVDGTALTNADAHGTINLAVLYPKYGTNSTATARAVFRVARPTTIGFSSTSFLRMFVDGVRLGSDMPRSWWGSVTLTPGLHTLKVVTAPQPKSTGWHFRVQCEVADTCRPGDLVLLPAAEVLRLDALPPETAARHAN